MILPFDLQIVLNGMFSTAAVSKVSADSTAVRMIGLGLVVLTAYLGGVLGRRLKFSEVTGQLIGGAIAGPYVLGALGVLPSGFGELYAQVINEFHFFVFVFLSLVAFGIGEELHLYRLKKVGLVAIAVVFIQGLLCLLVVTSAFYFIGHLDFGASAIIGCIGITTAPAVSFVLMDKLRVEGRLRNLFAGVVVLGDLAGVFLFSIVVQALDPKHGADPSGFQVGLMVAKEIALAILVGGLIFVVLRLLVRRRHMDVSGDMAKKHHREEIHFLESMLSARPSPSVEIFIAALATVSLGAGLAYYFHFPFLITTAFAGFMVSNFHSHAIFDSLKIENVAPLLNLGFFAFIGANLSLSSMTGDMLLLVILYIVTRTITRVFGTWLGCVLTKEDRKVGRCLPSLMLPQAGIGAVEAIYASDVLDKPEIAGIILPSIVFFEIVGIYMVDRGLRRWQSWVTGEEQVLRRMEPGSGPESASRIIMGFLDKQHVKIPLIGTTKQAVLEELVDYARKASDEYVDRAQALQMIAERERIVPTSLGNGIALPHCRLMGIEKPLLVMGVHPRGVPYGDKSKDVCDLFLMLISNANDSQVHLQVLAAVARLFQEPVLREKLRAVTSADEVLHILRETEAGMLKAQLRDDA